MVAALARIVGELNARGIATLMTARTPREWCR